MCGVWQETSGSCECFPKSFVINQVLPTPALLQLTEKEKVGSLNVTGCPHKKKTPDNLKKVVKIDLLWYVGIKESCFGGSDYAQVTPATRISAAAGRHCIV